MDSQNDVREFLRSRRAKVTPQQVNLMAGSNPRVPGLRREEVATLASVSGRLAQRRFAADLLDVPASELRGCYDCPRCGTGPGVSHGRPGYSFKEAPVPLLLSLSRAAGWSLLAAVADPAPGLRLGIDVEDSGRLDFDGFDAVALAPAERQGLGGLSGEALRRGRARLWTRKEAWLKMTGEGLRRAPETLDVLHRSGIRDLAPAETGLPADLVAAVALSAPA
jgi:4'-phosphopantetheinyl transferase